LNLSLLLDVPKEMKTFEFQFQTVKQNLSVYIDGLETYTPTDLTRMKLTGKIHTADVMDTETLKKAISAKQGENKREITLVSESNRTYAFTVENIIRGEERSTLTMNWALGSGDDAVSGEKTYG